MGPLLYPEEIYGIVSYLIFSISTFKKKTLACGSQEGHTWVTSGLLSGSSGLTGVIHFQPWWVIWVIRVNLVTFCPEEPDSVYKMPRFDRDSVNKVCLIVMMETYLLILLKMFGKIDCTISIIILIVQWLNNTRSHTSII